LVAVRGEAVSAVYINKIGTAVPPYDVHERFVSHAASRLASDGERRMFRRLVEKSQIEHRYSYLCPRYDGGALDQSDFYQVGRFPDTGVRMRFFEEHAIELATAALDAAGFSEVKDEITHLIVVSCTGFHAPGLDMEIISRFRLRPGIERVLIGFMGCYAALNALTLARHIVRSEPKAKVAVVNVELCTLHLQDGTAVEHMLRFLIWGDGASACVVSGEPAGILLRGFHSTAIPQGRELITWRIGASGFDLSLSSRLPRVLSMALPEKLAEIMAGANPADVRLWAVHAGGRSILDAFAAAIGLAPDALRHSRSVLKRFGNMSSATIMFVLRDMMESGACPGLGCGIAFGPGLTAQSMLFEVPG
jgi:alpha-pyrone synthase